MKLCKKLIPSTAALLAVLFCVAHARADAFEDAGRAFAEGHYAESVRGYESVLKTNGYSAAVLFNLGNAELRAGNVGEAILDYQRARWLAPHDPDIAANLRFAQKQAGLATTEESWSESAADFFSPNGWAWLASGTLAALCAGILGAQLRGERRLAFRWLGTAVALVLIAAGGALVVRSQELDRAVLPAKATPALVSPFDGAKTLFDFPAGQTVEVEKTHAGFCFVRDAGGHTGWVNRAQVATIVAAAPSA